MLISTCFGLNCISWIPKSHICSVRTRLDPTRQRPGTTRALGGEHLLNAVATHRKVSTYARGIPCGDNDRGLKGGCCDIRRCKIPFPPKSDTYTTARHIVS